MELLLQLQTPPEPTRFETMQSVAKIYQQKSYKNREINVAMNGTLVTHTLFFVSIKNEFWCSSVRNLTYKLKTCNIL